MRIGLVHLRVADRQRSLDFYTGLLGLHVAAHEGDTTTLSATGGTPHLLALTEYPGARAPERTTGLYHVAIRVSDAPALGQLLARLLAADYPLQGASDHPTNKAIYLADPDGNGIELTIDNPRAEWFGPDGHIRLESPPLDGPALLAAAGGAKFHIHSHTDIGHVHLHVADLPRAIAFYRNVLGLTVTSALPRLRAAFLAYGDYHHHIGLNTWNGVGAPRPAANAAGLLAYTILLPDTTDVETVLANAARHGARIVGTSGAIVDPDGHHILVTTADVPLAV